MSDDELARLYDQVYENPADAQIRHVLADALIARGDPRGELIQLQLQPDSDHELRAMKLVQQHGMTWLGPLRGIALPLAYERGFLASCQLVADPQPVLDRREWATVHTIELPYKATPWRFALHPVMRSLVRLERATPAMLLEYARATPAQLASIGVVLGYTLAVEELLELAPENALAAIAIRDIPHDRGDRIRALARRHPGTKLDLHVLSEPEPEPYEEPWPGELGS